MTSHRIELRLTGRGLAQDLHRIVLPPPGSKSLFRLNHCRQPLNMMVRQRDNNLCVSVWPDEDPKRRTCWCESLDVPWTGTRQLKQTHDRLRRALICSVRIAGIVYAPPPRPG